MGVSIRTRYVVRRQEDGKPVSKREAETLFQALARSAVFGVFLVEDGRFVYFNSAWLAITGYGSADLRGRDLLGIVHPEDRARVAENNVSALTAERSTPQEVRFLTKAGETRWAVQNLMAVFCEGRRSALGGFMDISTAKEAEGQLRARLRPVWVLFRQGALGVGAARPVQSGEPPSLQDL